MNNPLVYASVSLACQALSDLELAAIHNAAQTNFDPRPVMGYDKVKYLFTEQGGLRMHDEVLACLSTIVLRRLTSVPADSPTPAAASDTAQRP